MTTSPDTPERLRRLVEKCAATPGRAEGRFAAVAVRYLATGNAVDALLQPWPWHIQPLDELTRLAARFHETDELAARLAEIAVLNIGRDHPFVLHFFRHAVEEEIRRNSEGLLHVAERCGVPLPKLLAEIVLGTDEALSFGWRGSLPLSMVNTRHAIDMSHRSPPADLAPANPYERRVMETDEAALSQALLEIVTERGGSGSIGAAAISALAAFRPGAVADLMERARTTAGVLSCVVWAHVLKLTGRWDETFLEAATRLDPGERVELLDVLRRTGRLARLPAGIAMAQEAALDPQQPYPVSALLLLADVAVEELEQAFTRALEGDRFGGLVPRQDVFDLLAQRWQGPGRRIFYDLLSPPQEALAGDPFHRLGFTVLALEGLLKAGQAVPAEELRDWFRETLRCLERRAPTARSRSEFIRQFWKTAAYRASDSLAPEFLELLGSPAEELREYAMTALARFPREKVAPGVLTMLTSRRTDSRQGAAELLLHLADPAHVPVLAQALATETTPRVRQVLHEALTACSTAALAAGRTTEEEPRETAYLPRGRKLRPPPSADWLRTGELPALFRKDGTELDAAAVTNLIVTQGACKAVTPAADLLPLLARLDRPRSADFAKELLARYLAAGAPVEDRWALALAGMLGDAAGVIPPLQARIPEWCRERRYKLAEYAAQAISLLPGNEPLAALDALAKRYRQKFRNLGKACEDACAAALKRRGLSEEDLQAILAESGFPAPGKPI